MANTQINVQINGNSSGAQKAIAAVGAKAEAVLGGKLQTIMSKALNTLPIAGAAMGIGMIGTAVSDVTSRVTGLSDRLASTKARIDLINDGTQTTSELMDKVYAAANRSRGSYMEMANSVAKLNMLAKDAFNSNEEAIAFAEQMNKQFKISGASLQEQQAAMYQLTQAMAAGKLQGDEFRSIMENAPMLAQSLSKELGVFVGQLKNMSSEGALTADVIKSALLNSADETNAKFAELPMTFEEVGAQLQNSAIQAFQPVLDTIKSTTSIDAFQSVLAGVQTVFQGMAAAAQIGVMGIQGAFSVGTIAVSTFSNIVRSTGSVIAAFGPVAIGTFAGVTSYIVAARIATTTLGTAMTVQQAIQKGVVASTAAYNLILKGSQSTMVAYRGAMAAVRLEMTIVKTTTAGLGVLTGILRARYVAGKVATLAMAGGQAVLNAVMKANPIGFVIGLLIAIGSAFATASVASNGLSETLTSVWNSIVHTSAWAVNKVIGLINMLIKGFNMVGSKIAGLAGTSFTAVSEISELNPEDVQSFADTTGGILKQAFDFTAMPSTDVGDISGADSSGGIGSGSGSSRGGGSQGKGSEALEEAKRVHEAILDSWYDMFGKQSELVDRWLAKELEELEKSKTNNLNYEEDKTRLMEMYSKKREQALYEEAKRAREIQNSVYDMSVKHNLAMQLQDSSGATSPMTKFAEEYKQALIDIERTYQEYSDEYAAMSKRDQDTYIAALKAQGLAFELSKNNELKFTEQINAEKYAADENYAKQRAELLRTQAEEEWLISEAMRTQNFEALQQALSDEYVAIKENYELRKELMTEYQEAVMNSHWSAQEAMFNTMNAGLDSMEESLSSILQGTKSITTMFQNMGKAVLKTISDMAAQWIAAQLKQMLFGKMLQSQQTATSIAAANAQLGPWTQLAQQVSMATFGVSATTGMAAWSAASAMGQVQSASSSILSGGLSGNGVASFTASNTSSLIRSSSMIGLADGGLATGETYARIAEGKYPEAVLPLSENVFNQIGEGIARSEGGGGTVMFNISTMDAESFISWLGSKGGQAIKQYLYDNNREFVADTGVW